MNLRRVSKSFIIAVLSILIMSLLPGVALVWAEVGLGFQSGQSPSNFDGMIIGDRQDISPQNDGSGVEVVPAAAFLHTNEENNSSDHARDWFFHDAGGYIRNENPLQGACLMAPVYLQPGTTLKRFEVYVRDNSPEDNITIFFNRTSFADFDKRQLAVVTSQGASLDIQVLTATLTANTAVLLGYNYQVNLCLPAGDSTIRVKGAKVIYNPLSAGLFLPMVIKSPVTAPPNTQLTLRNNTGVTVDFEVIREAGTNDVVVADCLGLANGAEEDCGSFPSGIYRMEGDFGVCGTGSVNFIFPPGNCVRTITCPENGQRPSMQCN